MKKFKNLIRDILRLILTKKGYSWIRFILTHKYIPSLYRPQTFSEKIYYRKFNVSPYTFSKLADKVTVREFIKNKIGNEYLIPLYLITENLTQNDFINLPSKFVIKTSHGGGGNNVLVVKNKNDINIDNIISKFNSDIKINIGSKIDEYFYNIEAPKIIIEKMIENNKSTPLLDYKFHVFKNNGNTKLLLQINSEYNTKNCTKTLYDLSGNKSPIQFSNYKHGAKTITLPDNFTQMVNIAKKLSEDFEYVRVDLFNVDGDIYFGEMTFCPASGWDKLNSRQNDLILGQYWNEF